LDEEAATLTKSLDEKQKSLKELEDLALKQKTYRDLLGSHDVMDILEKYDLLKKSRVRKESELESLEVVIEKQRGEVERLQTLRDNKTRTADGAECQDGDESEEPAAEKQ